ncbi:MAG: hypothetical protein JWN27_1716 [Candidatus Eremiobacteraeota bacterium]|nr:hypothetical protein [Candidatus Eremiobacteraeota bacterium]
MQPRSAGTRIAAIVLLAGAVLFVLVSCRDPGYARLQLAGGSADPAAHRDVATFVVEAAPFSLIELSVNGRRAASAYVPWNAREVRFERTPLDGGSNQVVARTTLWYAASRRAHTAELQVENPPAPIVERARGTDAARAGPLAPRSRDRRSLALDVRQREVAAAFAVQLPRSDRAIVALQAGRIDVPAFVDETFGAPRFNRKSIAGFFTGARPQLFTAGDTVRVSADSGYQRLALEDLPAFVGDVEIANAFTGPTVRVAGKRDADPPAEGRRWAYDVLRLHVDDYRVVGREPPPLRSQGATYVWERPFADVRTHVVVSLSFAPFASVGALRRGLDLPVFAFAPHVLARFLAFFHGFVLAVPMFAYLVLSRGRNARFATVARRLIVVAVAADVFDACISAQPDVDGEIRLIVPALRVLPPSLVNLAFVPSLIGLVLALLAASLAHLAARTHTVAGTVVADAANAVRVAALGFAAIGGMGYAAGHFARGTVAYPALAAAALAAGLIGVLVALDWWTIPRPGASRRAFTIATVAFVVAAAVPLSLVQYGVWATVPEHAGTAFADPLSPLALTAAFLRSLAPLCPLAFGLLLLARVRPDPAAIGLDSAGFTRLVLCCYAVLAGVVVIVPVGFVLAWWTYGLLRAREASIAAPQVRAVLVPTPRERGLAAIPIALAFVLVEVLLLMPSETRHLRELHTPFLVLEAAGFVAVIAATLVMPAFAFAACGEELAGEPGLRKGLGVGAWAIGCSLPAWFLRSDGLGTAVEIVIAAAVFYGVLGLLTESQSARYSERVLKRGVSNTSCSPRS